MRALALALALVAASSARAEEAPARSRFVAEPRLALWLTQEASRLRTTHLSPGFRLAFLASNRIALDVGYQLALHEEGTKLVSVFNTLHALSLRVHLGIAAGPTTLTLGAGPAGTLVTVTPSFGGAAEPTAVRLAWGAAVALGAEARVGARLVRFEASAFSRATRIDLLFGAGVGW